MDTSNDSFRSPGLFMLVLYSVFTETFKQLIIVQNRILAKAWKAEKGKEFWHAGAHDMGSWYWLYIQKFLLYYLPTPVSVILNVSCIPLLGVTWIFQWLLHYFN